MKIDFIDIRRAYFHSPARRKVCIELPEGDREEGMCGELNGSMYGTRDVAQIGNIPTLNSSCKSRSFVVTIAHVFP